MQKRNELVRFDWAMKKLLRHKTNFVILEGFLTELTGDTIKIIKILESEGNQETENDKHNRVDMLVENSKGELVIIEVQNSKEYDYFHRILFGASKAITEYISKGEKYSKVKKVISVTIAYFDLGQGKDYIYHGTNSFKGIHKNDTLNLSLKQQELYNKNHVYEIFPEYWLIKLGKFNNRVSDKLDEWIYFLKNSEIKDTFSAKGLKEAKEKLDEMQMSDSEWKSYQKYLKKLMDIASDEYNKMVDIEERVERKTQTNIAKSMKEDGASIDFIIKHTGLSRQEIESL
jgi:predicted transposase/invertase (TIGR01784 family)